MNMQKVITAAGVTLICLLVTVTSSLRAQNMNLEPVVEDVWANDSLTWSPDGQSIVFQSYYEQTGAQVTDNSWYTYDIATETLSAGSNLWPLYPNFSSLEETLFNVAVFSDSPQFARSYVHPSPNGRFIVYTTRINSQLVLALGDRQQQTVNATDQPGYNPIGHLEELNVAGVKTVHDLLFQIAVQGQPFIV